MLLHRLFVQQCSWCYHLTHTDLCFSCYSLQCSICRWFPLPSWFVYSLNLFSSNWEPCSAVAVGHAHLGSQHCEVLPMAMQNLLKASINHWLRISNTLTRAGAIYAKENLVGIKQWWLWHMSSVPTSCSENSQEKEKLMHITLLLHNHQYHFRQTVWYNVFMWKFLLFEYTITIDVGMCPV